MNGVVWKYPLLAQDIQTIALPKGAKILTAQAQGTAANLWALVDPDETELEDRRILIVGTGHVRDALRGFVDYIGTFQLHEGRLVFHVFEHHPAGGV